MPQARDEAGNIWELDAQGNPVRLVSQGGTQGGQNTVVAPNPARAAKEASEAQRAADSAARDAARLGMTAEDQGRQNTKARIDNPQALRKEFAALPEVKAYNVAVQQLAQALNTGDGAQADLALTYAFAKAMDPESVVREAEQQMITTSQPWFQAMVENTQKQFGMDGAGNYSPEARAALRQQIIRSVDSRERLYAGKRAEFGQLAQRYGIDPYEVVGEHSGETFRKQFRDYDEKRRSEGANVPNIWEGENVERRGAASGATRNEYSADLSKRVDAMINAGASKQEIDAMLGVNGFPPLRDDQWGPVQKWRQDNPGKEYKGGNVNRSVANTALERLSGSGAGAALAGLANMGSFGGVQALAPDQYAAISEANPGLTMGGEVVGAITGTQGLGALGREAAKRLAPRLLGGKGAAQFGRNLAADAGYGAGYGGVTEGDPLGGAGAAALGSTLGQGIGGAVGKGLRGLNPASGTQELVNAGIPLTVGQRAGGQMKSIEDRLLGTPLVGDVVRDRRIEGLQALENVVQNQAGKPIGAQFPSGGNWIDELPPQFGQAYDDATAGANVPLDPQFAADLLSARAAGAVLPPDLAGKFNLAMQNRVRPAVDSGSITGEQYQQAMRGLKGYKAEHSKSGFEGDYRDALSTAMDALRSQMQRGGGARVTEGLDNADAAYRMAKVVQSAQQKALNGSMSGVPGLPTPAQLNTASLAAAKKYPGPRPFADILGSAQKVLPSKVPDSGTAGRLAQLALPAAMLGGGAAGGAAGGLPGGAAGTVAPLTLSALLMAAGTRRGQAALGKALFERPGAAKSMGEFIGRLQKRGLFGAPGFPLLLEAQSQ